MPFKKLTAKQLAERGGGRRVTIHYLDFLKGLKPGEGGITTVKQEKVSKQTIKNRLKKASKASGVKIKFVRSGAAEVVIERVK